MSSLKKKEASGPIRHLLKISQQGVCSTRSIKTSLVKDKGKHLLMHSALSSEKAICKDNVMIAHLKIILSYDHHNELKRNSHQSPVNMMTQRSLSNLACRLSKASSSVCTSV